MTPLCEDSTPPIRPLRDPLVLYLDETPESERVKEIIELAGIPSVISTGSVESYERKPLVLYGGGTFEGLDEVRGLLDLLRFWSQQDINSEVFAA